MDTFALDTTKARLATILLEQLEKNTQLEKRLLQCEKKEKNGKKIAAAARKVEKEKNKIPLNLIPANIPKEVINIQKLCSAIYDSSTFKYGGKESQYQAALEIELRGHQFQCQREPARLIHYISTTNETLQLANDIRRREDIILYKDRIILELKQMGKLTNKEHFQLFQYMEERKNFSDWGVETRGMLINFGDNNLEIWYIYYGENGRIQRVKIWDQLCKVPLVDTWQWYC